MIFEVCKAGVEIGNGKMEAFRQSGVTVGTCDLFHLSYKPPCLHADTRSDPLESFPEFGYGHIPFVEEFLGQPSEVAKAATDRRRADVPLIHAASASFRADDQVLTRSRGRRHVTG